MEVNRQVLWLWLKQALGGSNKRTRRLAEQFGSVEAVYRATDFSDCGLTDAEKRLLLKKDLKSAWEIYGDCEENAVGILVPEDPLYPALLREIDDPPVPLFFKGHLRSCLEQPTLTLVGTREASGYGERMAAELVQPLAYCGFTVVCGIADGIDGFVCDAALRAGGALIAVLPFGILSGRGHLTRRFNDILTHGALVSEAFPRSPSHKYAYHARNRILSGLSHGTVVIEAPAKSGALMTAGYAAEQGRDVFAVMANAHVKTAEGSNQLIKDGCFPVTDYTDILRVYLPLLGEQLKEIEADAERVVSLREKLEEDRLAQYRKTHAGKLTEAQNAVFSLLNTDGVSAESIIEQTGLPPDAVLQALTVLEFSGLAVSCPGSKYKIIL